MNKREFIEREMEIWKEKFEVPFEDEFKVRMLHDLRWTYIGTSDGHVKTKSDIINAILLLSKELNLKPKQKFESKTDLIIICNNKTEMNNLYFILQNMILDSSKVTDAYHKGSIIEINMVDISIRIFSDKNLEFYRGMSCNALWNLTGDKEIEKTIRVK